ncbi:MAG: DUF5680 domain-containing protein [Candidatus Paceibacterota bacterium]|jgi:hypothetical protein
MQPISLKFVHGVFLNAMAVGWAQNVQEIEVSEFPGSKAIPFVFGDFRVLDIYLVTPSSNLSSGLTTIWYKEDPVWTMHYGGWYTNVAIPFLKSCLHRAYVTERRFYGGRGPVFVRGERFTYVNKIERNDFANFAGEEHVLDLNEQCLGFHWYRGMSLIGNDQ